MLNKLMVVGGLLLLAAAGCGNDAPEARSGAGSYEFSYDSYAVLLENYVKKGLVDYASLKENRTRLDSLVAAAGWKDLSQADDQTRLAFYINAYNIITVRSVVDAYPVESIKDIGGVWTEKKWPVAGKELTLDQIEHEVIRKEFDEPRIHAAINCAAYGCPALAEVPYYPDRLDSLLMEASIRFARSDRYNEIDVGTGTVRLSAIFEWFGEDFIEPYYDENRFSGLDKKQNAAVNFLLAHLPDETAQELRSTDLEVEYLEYDWSLNDLNR